MQIIVIKCKGSKYVPFYLTKRYKSINENQIYTRLGDTNTPKNKSANYSDIENYGDFILKEKTNRKEK